jgi:hypothetical protein
MIEGTVLSHGTLIILLFFSLLLSANAASRVSHVYNVFPITAFGQQIPGSDPPTTPTSASPIAAATITPASEIGKTVRPSSIVLMNIEDLRATDRTGDAEVDPNSLKISSAFADEESAHTIQYTPAALGFAGIAYEADKNYDLSNAQRVVFFAKGQNGGENVTFAAVGRNENTGGFDNTSETLDSAFNSQNFSLISEDVSLNKDWTRYQISLEGVNLDSISHPFAFIVNKGPGQEAVTFSLRDITYDSKPATDPLEIVEQPVNQTGLPAITSAAQSNNTGVSNGTQDLSLAQESDDQGVNATGSFASLDGNNTSTDDLGRVPSNETQAASNHGEHDAAENSSSLLIDTTLPLFPNATSSETGATGNNVSDSTGNSNSTEPKSNPNANSIIANPIDNGDGNTPEPVTLPSNASLTTVPSILGPQSSLLNSGSDFSGPNANIAQNSTENSISSLTSDFIVGGSDQILPGPENELDNISKSQISETRLVPDGSFDGTTPQDSIDQNQNQKQSSFLVPSAQSNTISNDTYSIQPRTNTISGDVNEVTVPPYLTIPSTTSPLASTSAADPALQQQIDEGSHNLPFIQYGSPIVQFENQSSLPVASLQSNTIGNTPALEQQQQQSFSSVTPTTTANPYNPAVLDTIITSATDTNTGTTILSGTETTSNSITFTFQGSDRSANAGYTCSIENLEPFQCSSPVIYDTNILQEGGLNSNAGPQAHSFQVSAIASSGDVDSTPSTFEWTTTGSAGSETIPQETIPQETIPQETIPQETIPQELPTAPQSQQQQPQITVQGPLAPSGFVPSELPTGPQSQQQQPQITVQGPLAPSGFVPSELPTGPQSQQQQPQITVQGPLAPSGFVPSELPTGPQSQQQQPQITVQGPLTPIN